MTSDDQKPSKKQKVTIRTARGVWKAGSARKTTELGSAYTLTAGRLQEEVVRVYGPYVSKGTRKQQLADKLTAEFEKLLASATEATLREALESLRTLQVKAPSRVPVSGHNVVTYRRNASGKFVNVDATKPRSALSITYGSGSGGGTGGGTGSTGPGKPKARK